MIDTTTDSLRHDRAALLAALSDAGADVARPNSIRCPFHDDAHPSAGIFTDDAGVWRFKCHGCGVNADVYDVRSRAKGTSLADELKAERSQPSPAPRSSPSQNNAPRLFGTLAELAESLRHVTARYEYTNPETRVPDLVVFRIEAPGRPKRFIQAHQIPAGPWVMQAPPKPWPIYNRARVAGSDRVVIVEGEKCVHALHDLGIVATTTPTGAGKAEHADLSPLAGRTCILWPDADQPDANGKRTGISHMRDVAKRLALLDPPARVLWLDPDLLDLGDKGDATDLIERLPDSMTPERKRQAVEDVLSQAQPTGPSSEVATLIGDAIEGRRRIVPMPWNHLSKLTRALIPGTLTLLVASPGATKSLMLIQAASYWLDHGEAFAVLELEDGRGFHLRRALAQRVSESGLTDDEWVKENPDIADRAVADQSDFLDRLGACIHELPDDAQPTLDLIADWIEHQALAGKRVIAVDPVSIAKMSDRAYIDDQAFVSRVKRITEQSGASLVLVMHPKKHAQGRDTDDIAGGAAYGRLAHTVIWLEHTKETQTVTVRDSTMDLPVEADINRVAHLTKTRNGRGQGLRIGYYFSGRTLCLTERGVIVKHGE